MTRNKLFFFKDLPVSFTIREHIQIKIIDASIEGKRRISHKYIQMSIQLPLFVKEEQGIKITIVFTFYYRLMKDKKQTRVQKVSKYNSYYLIMKLFLHIGVFLSTFL